MAIPTIKEIAGVITEPELRFTPQGKAVMSVRLAFNDSKYNEQTREWENTKTFYVDGTAWEQAAERLTDQIRKGDQVFVEGRLDTQSWEKDGEKKSKPNLTIRTMRKLEKVERLSKPTTPYEQQQPAQSWGGAPNNDAQNWGVPSGQGPAF